MTSTQSMTDLGARLQAALGSGYIVDHEIGGGGMSRVFAARDTALNRDIVVKVLPPDLAGEVSVERFKREIRIAASLQHPHIVPVHAAGDVDGLPYYTMPLVDGESLRDRLSRVQRLAVNEALPMLRDIGRALAHAHRRGVVHRDIKPENVLITHGVAVVTDFGIAKALAASRGERPERAESARDLSDTGLTLTGTSIGTPNYMAPEQSAGDPQTDHRADIYSLGVVAYELLSGSAPFHGRTPRERLAAQLAERPRDLAALRLDLPPAVAGLVMRCLEKEPDARPQSADEVVRELEAAIGGAPAEPVGDEPAVIRRAFALYVVAFVAVTAVAWLATRGIGLPDWVLPGTAIVMALGLPVVAFTAMTRYAAFRSAGATGGDGTGAKPWHLTTGSRGRWAAQQLSWRRVATGGALSLGGFGALVAGFMFMRNAGIGPAGSLIGKGALQARERILVTDFRVTGVDSDLVGAINVAAKTALMQSRAVSILPGEAVNAALARMRRPRNAPVDLDLGRELARREGIRAVITGHVTRTGSRFDVGMQLVSADSGRDLAAFHAGASGVEDLIPTIDALTRELRGKIGESLKSVRATRPLPDVTTSSIEALKLYAEHLRVSADDQPRARELLRQAVAIDSEFAMAYRRLWVLGGAGTPEGDSALKKAVRLRDRLSETERLAVDAAHYYAAYLFPDNDRAKAIALYEQLAAMGDPLGMNNLPNALLMRREFARAESLDVIGVAKFPDEPSFREELVHAQVELGKLDDAERNVNAALAKFPNAWLLQWWKIRMLYFRGHVDQFERAVDSLSQLPDPTRRRVGTNMRSEMALLHGQLRLRDRIDAQREPPPGTSRPNALGEAEGTLWLNRMVTRRDIAQAVQRVDELLRDTPLRGPQQVAGIMRELALAGRPDLARYYLNKWLGSSPNDSLRAIRERSFFIHQSLAFVLIAEGKPREAIDEVRLGDRRADGPYGPCMICYHRDLGLAFDAAGEADSAIVYYESFLTRPSNFTLLALPGELHHFLRRLGELYQATGNREKAIEYYSRFVELWKNADTELQPQVADVRARIARLRAS